MKYARLVKGVVIEIVDFDPTGRFVKEIEEQFIECDEETKQNQLYQGGKFVDAKVEE